MNAKELAQLLDGSTYSQMANRHLAKEIEASGLVVAYGFSDDLLEFEGAISDEVGAYGGALVHIKDGAIVKGPDGCNRPDDCPFIKELLDAAQTIEATYNSKFLPCWTIKTDIPHETFNIYEEPGDSGAFSVGIVFDPRSTAQNAHQEQEEPAAEIDRLTDKNWRSRELWELCERATRCECECHGSRECAKGYIAPKIYDRLAQYEDCGLEPEEVALAVAALMGRELAQIVEFNDVPLARLIELAKAEKDNGSLTTEELWSMDGHPVWCVDGAGHAAWCLIDASRGKEFRRAPDAIDSDTGLWDGDFYAMTGDGANGLHCMGWLAYRRKPEGGKDNA